MDIFHSIKLKCQLCGIQPRDHLGLCEGCCSDLPWLTQSCYRCAMPVTSSDSHLCGQCLRGDNKSITRSFIPLSYEFPINALISEFKFHHQLGWSKFFSSSLLEHLQTRLQPEDVPDLLLPMPLHQKRQRERGFNQSELLAKFLGKKLGIRVDSQLCIRTKNTPSQAGLNKRERKRNLTNAFTVGNLPARIEHIAIVDDVVTTGASCRALAKCLQAAGVKRIDVWAVARTSI